MDRKLIMQGGKPKCFPKANIPLGSLVLVHSDLYELVQDYLGETIIVFDVEFERGRAKGWKGLMDSEELNIRGDDQVKCRCCEECGDTLYYATGDQYICAPGVKFDKVRLTDLQHMVIPEQLVAEVSKLKMKGVQLKPMTYLETPKDGLPADLRAYVKSLAKGKGA
ncbi:hypothetical protein [Persicirhabdus sediminis]|uniref:Uncharacterized protein n=1 Tax=Persicirhabdus sediminis TaxID=454144 RepID=A0A8J7MEV7_9BACT|nr:hypothetical protein [Persicirhabdus sediminis]MBK1791405.1 hypothetical protein [Persicirhabdus sediminis]